MRRRSTHDDAGQALPIYITVVGGLLFLAFAYLAVGQAAANRNGAQTAADAAALAAAQDTRGQLAGDWLKDVLDPAKWQDIFDGRVQLTGDSCRRAHELAGRNAAQVESCGADGPLRYTVDVRTDKSVGDSIVPGTESRHSRASATAVIEPLCTFELHAVDAEENTLPSLSCRDRSWPLDPQNLGDVPGPEDLFDVHLAE
ncbi:pilus assembly protein TadG-related protein [Streptomyces sp. NPDC003697]